jgi:ribosome-binding protein aMBF1 (putative translation factor)
MKEINRRLTAEERKRHAETREAAYRDFPPKKRAPTPSAPGLPAAIRAAREAQGLTWYALAQKAGIPNQTTIRDIEIGRDVKLSNLEAVVKALGMQLALTPARV